MKSARLKRAQVFFFFNMQICDVLVALVIAVKTANVHFSEMDFLFTSPLQAKILWLESSMISIAPTPFRAYKMETRLKVAHITSVVNFPRLNFKFALLRISPSKQFGLTDCTIKRCD